MSQQLNAPAPAPALRRRLLTSCAGAAMAVAASYALPAQKAVAQGFVGTPVANGATVNGTNTLVTVTAPNGRAIINWNDAANDFLPNGNSATFTGNSNYIVLNRVNAVNPNAPVQFNGTVNSNIGGQVPGGQVWFYSGSGILVGGTARFNVGSLLLSANNIGDTDFLDGDNNFTFQSASNSTAGVVIAPYSGAPGGTQINAIGSGAYVALIAPRVRQSGNIKSNGSVAFVAGEQVDMTVAGSLFDFSVPVGSSLSGTEGGANGSDADDAALIHDGNTTLETGYGYNTTQHRAIMVAVPKNDAVTMLVAGNIGYQTAGGASVVGDRVILLAAGHTIDDNEISTRAPATGGSDIRILGNSSLAMNVSGVSTRSAAVRGGNITLGGRLDLSGVTEARVDATGNINVANSVVLDASGTGTAGTAALTVGSGAQVVVQGTLTLNAGASGDSAVNGGNATAGQVLVSLESGAVGLVVANRLNMDASGFADDGANGTGGLARISVLSGILDVGDGITLHTDGYGGNGVTGATGGRGGDGSGGRDNPDTPSVIEGGSHIYVAGGQLETNNIFLYADGQAGRGGSSEGSTGFGGLGGTGTGGSASIELLGFRPGDPQLDADIEVNSSINISAAGEGGAGNSGLDGGDGGLGMGGSVRFNVASGSLRAFEVSIDADGVGGPGGSPALPNSPPATTHFTGDGGTGQGGLVDIDIGGSVILGFSGEGSGQLFVSAQGIGGNLFEFGYGESAGASGGAGRGGSIFIDVTGELTVYEYGYGSAIEATASGRGGGLEDDFFGGEVEGTAGDSFGGQITFNIADGGTVSVDNGISLRADAGDEVNCEECYGALAGGDATGGEIWVTLAGSILDVDGEATPFLDITAVGNGGGGLQNRGAAGRNGGDGTGGSVELTIAGSEIAIPIIEIQAYGAGGDAGDFFQGGSRERVAGSGAGGRGEGGDVTLRVRGGDAFASDILVNVQGDGGQGAQGTQQVQIAGAANGGNGGDAEGGSITLLAEDGGTLQISNSSFAAYAEGGEAGYGATTDSFTSTQLAGDGGRGGAALGGTITLTATGAGSLLNIQSLYLGASAEGGDGGIGGEAGYGATITRSGDGGDGGAAEGGTILIVAEDGATVELADNQIEAWAEGGEAGYGARTGTQSTTQRGGDGGNGGNAQGGTITLMASGGSLLEIQSGYLDASAYGGRGGYGGEAGFGSTIAMRTGDGGDGGDAQGGTITLLAQDGSELIADLTESLYIDAIGGEAGYGAFAAFGSRAGRAGHGGTGGDGIGGTLRLATLDGELYIDSGLELGYGYSGGLGEGRGGDGGDGGSNAHYDEQQVQVGEDGYGPIYETRRVGPYLRGNGGNGGKGTGGSILIDIQGGTVTAPGSQEGSGPPDISFFTTGFGGEGGDAGERAALDSRPDDILMPGFGGDGIGGTIGISVADRLTPGVGEFGFTTLEASGDPGDSGGAPGPDGDFYFNYFGPGNEIAGTVTIRDTAIGPDGGLSFSNLNVYISGFDPDNSRPEFLLESTDGPITVGGNVYVYVADGQASFSGGAEGGLAADGNVEVGANEIRLQQISGDTIYGDNILLRAFYIDGYQGSLHAATDIGVIADTVGIGVARAGDDFLSRSNGGFSTFGAGYISTGGADDTATSVDYELGLDSSEGNHIVVDARSGIYITSAISAGRIQLTAQVEDPNDEFFDGPIETSQLTAAEEIIMLADGNVRLGSASAGTDLVVETGGTIMLDGGEIEAAGGSATFDGPTVMNGPTSVAAASTVNFTGTVNGNAAETDDSLAVASGTGTVFAGNVGATTPLQSLAATGPVRFNGSIVTTVGDQSYDGLVTLGTDLVMTGANGSFTNGVQGGDNDLTLNFSGTTALDGSFTDIEDLATGGGGVTTLAGLIITQGTQSYDEAVTVTDSAQLVSNGTGAAGAITFAGTLNGDGALSVSSDGSVTFGGAVGAATPLLALEVYSGGNVTAPSIVVANDLYLDVVGSVSIGSATAGDDIEAIAGGPITIASATTTGLGEDESGYGFDNNAGSNILLGSQGAISLADADAFDYLLVDGASFTSTGALNAGDSIIISATGAITVASATAGDDIIAFGDGPITFTSATTTGLGQDGIDEFDEGGYGEGGYGEGGYGGGYFDPDGSNIRLIGGGEIRLDDGTAINLVQLNSDTGAVRSSGLITARVLDATAATSIALFDLDIQDGIFLTTTGGSISGNSFDSGGAIQLTSSGDINVLNLVAVDAIQASGGNLTLGTLDAGRNITLEATGNIALTSADATGDFRADAGGSFTADTIVTRNPAPAPLDGIRGLGGIDLDGNSIFVANGGALTIRIANSAGDVNLQSTGGAVQVTTDLVAAGAVDARGTAVNLNAINALAVRSATATAGNVALTTGGDLTVQAASATGSVNATSGATLGLNGTIGGSQIILTSRDIAVGTGAQVGSAAQTQTLAITANVGNAAVLLGGAAAGSGYTLDNAELGRLASRDISFTTGGSTGELQIAALTLRGSAASNPNVTRNFAVGHNGALNVTGAVALGNAGAQNGLSLGTTQGLFVDLGAGGVSVADGAGAVTGTLELRGQTILVSTTGARTALQNASTVAARDARLGTNDGAVNEAGVLRAGGVRLVASQRIHVQNTGGPDNNARAGITAGAAGITLVASNQGTPVEVIINGRQQSGGTTITGGALIDELTLEAGYGSFAAAPGSTVNGCPFTGGTCGQIIVEPEPPFFDPDLDTVVGDLIDDIEGEGDPQPPDIIFSDLIRIERAALSPIIDEPVTGSGNDDLYMGFLDDDEEEEEEADEPVTGSGNESLVNQPGEGAAQPTVDEEVTGSGNEGLVDNGD